VIIINYINLKKKSSNLDDRNGRNFGCVTVSEGVIQRVGDIEFNSDGKSSLEKYDSERAQ